jgi:hypothetical protein
MSSRVKLALVAGMAATVLLAGGQAANASGSTRSPSAAGDVAGPICPERAPLYGYYFKSVVASDGHHYDVYRRVTNPLQILNLYIVDCDS